jgi:hypothetical protein
VNTKCFILCVVRWYGPGTSNDYIRSSATTKNIAFDYSKSANRVHTL